MNRMRDPRKPGFYVQAPLSPYHQDITSQARWALGLGRDTRYPNNPETLHATLPSGMRVRLLPKPPRSSRGAHRTTDRLQAYCEYCGKWFGTGNISQHQIVHGVGSERELQRYQGLKSRGYPASLKRYRESSGRSRTTRDPAMSTWRVFSLDVWGNPRDGFEVNDRSGIGSIQLNDDATDAQIVRALKDAGIMRKTVRMNQLRIDGDDMLIFIDQARDARPVFQLERQ